MVVIRTEEESMFLIEQGFKPYYHKGVGRWYLRRGQERHIIHRGIEAKAQAIAERLKPTLRRISEHKVAEAIKMRLEGMPVSAIVEETGMPRSTLYEKFSEYDKGKLQLKLSEPVQAEPSGSVTMQKVPTSTPEVEGKTHTPNIMGEVAKAIQDFFNESVKRAERILSKPENVKAIADIIINLAELGFLIWGLQNVPKLREKGFDVTPIVEKMKEVIDRHSLNEKCTRQDFNTQPQG